MASLTTAIPGNSTVDSAVTSITADNTLQIIYYCCGTIGLIGNALVLSVLASSKQLRIRVTNMYIINQSAVDLAVSLMLIMSTAIQDTGRYLEGSSDWVYCRGWLTKMPLWGMLVSSTYNLVVITFERYLAVVHAIWHKMSFTQSKAAISIAFVWFIGPFYNMAYMLPTTIIQDGGCNLYSYWPSGQTAAGVGIFTIFIQYFVPLFILGFCYIKMFLFLRKKVQPQSDKPGASSSNSMGRAMRNIIKTLVLVCICFIACWTCNQIYFLLYNLGQPVDFTSSFYHFTVIAVFCNCCINPIIYMAKYETFQTRFKKILGIKETQVGGQDSGSNAGTNISTVTKPSNNKVTPA